MQAATKTALKRRVKKWGDAQRAGFASPTDMLHAKVQYLEDVLGIYQQEVEVLSAALRDARSDDLLSNSEDLGGGLRHQAPRYSSGAATGETELLKMQLVAAETELLELREGFQTQLANEVQHHAKRVAELEAALERKEAELDEVTERRLELEREASQATRRLNHNNEFLSSLDQTSMKVRENLERQLKHHQQLVASLLQTSGDGEGAGKVDKADGDGDEGQESTRGDDAGLASTRSGGTTDGKRQRHPGGAAGGTASTERDEKSLSASASHLPSSLVGRTPIERLSNILAKVEAVISSQQVELAVATRCAIESFALKEKELRNKAQQSYAYCEAQMSRMKELEEQFLEQRDYANQERDRALNTRDRLVSQLRSLEAQRASKTTTKSAEVQTIMKGDFTSPGLGERVDSFFFPSSASVASHGTSHQGKMEKKSSK